MGRHWIRCPVCGKERIHHAKGLCKKCYSKFKRLEDNPELERSVVNRFRERGFHISKTKVEYTEGGFCYSLVVSKGKFLNKCG